MSAKNVLHPLRDHPRSRGVYEIRTSRISTSWGSSPLARGLHYVYVFESTTGRIIPARAGFTTLTLLGIMNVKDHPRSRGVYGHNHALIERLHGSSPLARGLRQLPNAA